MNRILISLVIAGVALISVSAANAATFPLFETEVGADPREIYLNDDADPREIYLNDDADPVSLDVGGVSDPRSLDLGGNSDPRRVYLNGDTDPRDPGDVNDR